MRLLWKGAEACLYIDSYLGLQTIRKQRIPKPYRHPELDKEIRTGRTVLEGRLLSDARRNGVPTPVVFQIDTESATLMMEYIEGPTLRDSILSMSRPRIAQTFERLGQYVAKLHNGAMVHGDLTTSNVITDGADRLSIIDFGLGEFSAELEARGVDLHLLLRTLESSHSDVLEYSWNAFQKGYRRGFTDDSDKIFAKVREIRRRGRYIEERKQK